MKRFNDSQGQFLALDYDDHLLSFEDQSKRLFKIDPNGQTLRTSLLQSSGCECHFVKVWDETSLMGLQSGESCKLIFFFMQKENLTVASLRFIEGFKASPADLQLTFVYGGAFFIFL